MYSVFVSIFVSTLVVYLLSILFKRYYLWYKLYWIPGPPALPLCGNYSELNLPSPEGAFRDMHDYYQKYGKTHIIWIGTRPLILCQDIDIIQQVFKQEDKTRRPPMYIYTRNYLGPGLLFGEADEIWRLHRRFLSDSFHNDIIDSNIDLTVKKVHKLIDILDAFRTNFPDKPIDLIEVTKPCFFDVSVGSITGVDSNSQENPEFCPYLEAIESMSEMVMARLFSPLLKINVLFNMSPFSRKDSEVKRVLKCFVKTILRQRKSVIENDPKSQEGKHHILADAMLKMEEKKQLFTKKNVEDHVSNNLLAAYDTLATVTSYLLFILGNDEKLQDEVLQEIDHVSPNILAEGTNLKELSNMKLLDRCVKECLRMFPPAPMIGRHLVQPFHTKDGTLPAGVDVYINLYNYHRDENLYPNADVFDHKRWLPENSTKRHPHAWLPFGLGSRSCIGQKTAIQQSKAAVAVLLKKFSFKSFERVEDLKLSANLVLKSKDGIRVYVKPRY